MKLLLIEDDRNITLALRQALAAEHVVDIAADGADGLFKAATRNYGLIILDLQLPDIPGLKVCERLRAQDFSGPILVLSGEAKVISKIGLLDAGADDYLTKPFSLGELKARLRVLSRRTGTSTSSNSNRLTVGDLTLDRDKYQVERGGQTIKLRRKEFALLECLMQHAGTVVTRDILGSYAWRDNEDPWTNTIDVHIKYLRDKIDRPFGSNLIRTVHGLGYTLDITTTDSQAIAKTTHTQSQAETQAQAAL
ncbi:MAG: response regulator transcription factor [Candidatus Saccharimonadales bacterium]